MGGRGEQTEGGAEGTVQLLLCTRGTRPNQRLCICLCVSVSVYDACIQLNEEMYLFAATLRSYGYDVEPLIQFLESMQEQYRPPHILCIHSSLSCSIS